MQTSLARRQRHRRALLGRSQAGGGSAARRILLVVFLTFLMLTVVTATGGLVFVAAAVTKYSEGLPDPKTALADIQFEQQTVLYDRTGKIELARLGELKREVVKFEEIPPEMLDATTAIEDQDFWKNPGFDPVGILSAGIDTLNGRPRGGSTITQQLVRARLLPASAFEGSTYERKIREIIQSIKLTQAYPGDAGKQQIITAYLNQNFYGNNSYGVKAAAKGYFGKALKDLTLAQFAILAAIPQSPTRFDLMRNADQVCRGNVPDGECDDDFDLVVPANAEIVVRRNHVLDLMKTHSTQSSHTAAEYDAAKLEPVVLTPVATSNWKAPHFVWQVRKQLAQILCPDKPQDCDAVDTGGYKVTTTLDYTKQKIAEKYVFAAARTPNAKDPRALLKARGIPQREWSWILGLRGHNIHNAAAGVVDYRTGEVLAYVGSANYTGKGNKKFQPQWDVMADGWRQPGSAIKPIDYLIGVDDGTLTAATMFMDVTTDFGHGYVPTQADKLERGPVRLRSALQFSLNIPAIKAGVMIGLDHLYERNQDLGITYKSTARPVVSMGIGTLEVHPIDLLGAYATMANGGLKMPRTTILSIEDDHQKIVWPLPSEKSKGEQVVSPQAAYILTDILAGNTDKKINPYWGKWAIYQGSTRRPAAYKTGTTSENVDVAAYGYLAPPKDKTAPALAVGVWMGNSDNSPNDGKLSLDTSAPLWSAILEAISKNEPIAQFKEPKGLKTAKVDAFTGMKPGPFTRKTVTEIFVPGTVPTKKETSRIARDIDEASGLLWQDGCVGPKVTRGFTDISEIDAAYPSWQKADRNWASRAARGSGVRGSKGTRTSYFYNGAFAPFGRTWGIAFAPSKLCPLAPEPTKCYDPLDPTVEIPCPPVTPDPGAGGGKPKPSPKPKP